DGVPIAVVLGLRLVDGAHAAGAECVHEDVGSQNKVLSFVLKESIGLELAKDALTDQVLGQGRGFGARLLLEKLAHDLVQLPAVDEVAALQVPDEPFTGS